MPVARAIFSRPDEEIALDNEDFMKSNLFSFLFFLEMKSSLLSSGRSLHGRDIIQMKKSHMKVSLPAMRKKRIKKAPARNTFKISSSVDDRPRKLERKGARLLLFLLYFHVSRVHNLFFLSCPRRSWTAPLGGMHLGLSSPCPANMKLEIKPGGERSP